MLIDTYDSLLGVKKAIDVALRYRTQGFELAGVRLDSGDLARLSLEIRKMLDAAGLYETRIMASNELDEHLILDLKQQGARINLWGVGTNLVTGKDQPALDGVFKLSAIQDERGVWQDRLKLSEQTAKVTNPGILQIRRFFDGTHYIGDAIYDELLGMKESCSMVPQEDPHNLISFSRQSGTDLLQPILRRGKLVTRLPSLEAIQIHAREELKRLPLPMLRFTNPQMYCVGLEQALYEKKLKLIRVLRQRM
jgi:nicotinate phosphoribosyltransferase